MAIQMAKTCPVLSAALTIIPIFSQAEFLLRWLMPAQPWTLQQCSIQPLLSRSFPLWRNWQRMGIELAPHHRLLMIRRAGQAWRAMSAAIIYFLPWSRRGAAQGWGRWFGDTASPQAPERGSFPSARARGCACSSDRRYLTCRHFDLLLYMQHWHSFHCTYSVHQAFGSG